MADLIQPRILRGFRDYPPNLMIPRERLLESARRVYRSYGFAPIDTPALEYTEILLGKGGEESDKQLYRFTDAGERDIALRFDLTVPFARFAAMHIAELGTPFKRYHMGPVWRGEKSHRGRYREFWQCDFDTIGTRSSAADIEVVLVIHDLFQALGVSNFQVRINHRDILNGFLDGWGLPSSAQGAVLRALDKLPKIGAEAVQAELLATEGMDRDQTATILRLAQINGPNQEVVRHLRNEFELTERSREGLKRLEDLCQTVVETGIGEDYIQFDLSIARGLDYYTGMVYETFLGDLPGIGSVCSGGRYDNLAGLYTKQQLPGVGASLGLDRLLAALEELNLLGGGATPAPVLIVQFSAERLGAYERMARALRKAGIGAEVYPEDKKVGAQLQYAEKRGFALALIAGPDEFAQGAWKVKNLARRQEVTVTEDAVIATVQADLLS